MRKREIEKYCQEIKNVLSPACQIHIVKRVKQDALFLPVNYVASSQWSEFRMLYTSSILFWHI